MLDGCRARSLGGRSFSGSPGRSRSTCAPSFPWGLTNGNSTGQVLSLRCEPDDQRSRNPALRETQGVRSLGLGRSLLAVAGWAGGRAVDAQRSKRHAGSFDRAAHRVRDLAGCQEATEKRALGGLQRVATAYPSVADMTGQVPSRQVKKPRQCPTIASSRIKRTHATGGPK